MSLENIKLVYSDPAGSGRRLVNVVTVLLTTSRRICGNLVIYILGAGDKSTSQRLRM